jgi:D-xylose 1-dehydrogenase (NADP+, D-xylono-1,5-lactone-forming)
MNFGIIGAANIAIKVSKAINSTEKSKVVAIASRDIEKAKKFASENGIPNYFGSYEEILEFKEVDAIYIPLPTSLCTEWCIKAAKAKKHIL